MGGWLPFLLSSTSLLALLYFLVVNGTYSLQLLLASRELRQRRRGSTWPRCRGGTAPRTRPA